MTYSQPNYANRAVFLAFGAVVFWAWSSGNALLDRVDIKIVERDGSPRIASAVVPTDGEAAPDIPATDAAAYIARFSELAQEEQAKFGIPASITLAQGLLESKAGSSKLCRATNNHFGMKCFSKGCAKGHCANFTDDTHKDFFRKYPSAWASFRDHSKMLTSGRYAALKGKGAKEWCYGLKRLGYATSRTYSEDLLAIIQRHNLNRFDR